MKWYVDDYMEKDVIAAYDPSRHLSIFIFDTSNRLIKTISMYDEDEINIKIKKVD